jgi:hypothetical protein
MSTRLMRTATRCSDSHETGELPSLGANGIGEGFEAPQLEFLRLDEVVLPSPSKTSESQTGKLRIVPP